MLNEQEMIEEMLQLATAAGVRPTGNLPKIAAARVRMGLDISRCPCAAKDGDRGCISDKCLQEIKEKGVCHCNCFQR